MVITLECGKTEQKKTCLYLERVKILDNHIQILIKEREKIFEMISLYKSPADMTERVQTSPLYDKIGLMVANADEKYRDVDKRVMSEMEQLAELRLHTINQIYSLKDARYVEVLERKYIKYENWHDISEHMFFEKSQVFQLLKDARKTFYSLFWEEIEEAEQIGIKV